MIGIIIQARSQSKRMPRKIYAPFNNGKHSIQCILEGAKKTIVPHKIILAMPKEDEAEIKSRISELDDYVDGRFDLFVSGGDQNDLVGRYHEAMRRFDIDVCIRLTADCPMHIATSDIIDDMIMEYIKLPTSSFMGNNLLVSKCPYPCGIDVEIFNYEMICWTKTHAKSLYDLEHCVPMMYGKLSPFGVVGYENVRPNRQISTKISDFSLDTPEDYSFLKILMENYDLHNDLNMAIENTHIVKVKTNMSKNFRQ